VVIIRYNSLNYLSGGYVVPDCKLIVHPKFNEENGDNDIAIIKTPEPLVLGQINSGSICLPAKNSDPSAGKTLTAIGWGRTDLISPNPRDLKTVNVGVVSRKSCKNIYLKLSFVVNDNMICAGGSEDNICFVSL
jgi:hypothetical protein